MIWLHPACALPVERSTAQPVFPQGPFNQPPVPFARGTSQQTFLMTTSNTLPDQQAASSSESTSSKQRKIQSQQDERDAQ